ncbi:MAG: metallophosphoesterase, partial [Rhodospirillales bacterium]|nr:metallophosphoesterase [Rhodospirillales bacterium]
MAELREKTSQIELVHISDVHFGDKHRFIPPQTPLGDRPEEAEFPSLLDKLKTDLDDIDPGCPVLICITGDIAERADVTEFQRAEEFIRGLAEVPILGRARGLGCIFLVPGNHDVAFNSGEIGIRWQQWTEFFNRTFNTNIKREEPWAFVKVHDRVDDLNAVVVSLNSSIYVEEGKPDEDRGRLDIKQLTVLEKQLEDIDATRLTNSVRVALIHHHPVLLPPLAEPNRGYDAVHNSGKLLAILRRYGFHVVLHGHKHNPHTFTDDTRSAHQEASDYPILIAAGGSAGSTSLPHSPNIANCYNRITIKWHPEGCQARVRVETRGLNIFNKDGTERLPTRWNWYTMGVDDRHFLGLNRAHESEASSIRKFG